MELTSKTHRHRLERHIIRSEIINSSEQLSVFCKRLRTFFLLANMLQPLPMYYPAAPCSIFFHCCWVIVFAAILLEYFALIWFRCFPFFGVCCLEASRRKAGYKPGQYRKDCDQPKSISKRHLQNKTTSFSLLSKGNSWDRHLRIIHDICLPHIPQRAQTGILASQQAGEVV